VLDPAQPTHGATTGVDRRNNLEQVAIPAAEKGDFVITVSGHELARGPQAFALVVSDVSTLEGLTLDGDGDGAFADSDCDDADPGVHPAAREVPGNGKDDDCDPKTSDAPSGDVGLQADGGDLGADGGDLEVGGGGGCSCHTHVDRPVNQQLSLMSFFCILGLLVLFRRRGC
jgi:hypothetical protein